MSGVFLFGFGRILCCLALWWMADSAGDDCGHPESDAVTELLPKNGLVYSEKANLSEVRAEITSQRCDH